LQANEQNIKIGIKQTQTQPHYSMPHGRRRVMTTIATLPIQHLWLYCTTSRQLAINFHPLSRDNDSITRQPQPGCLQLHQITSRDHVSYCFSEAKETKLPSM